MGGGVKIDNPTDIYVGVVALDVAGAYDNFSPERLLHNL